MMRHVISEQLSDFAAIYEDDVEIVSVSRPETSACEDLARKLVDSRQLPRLRWVQAAGDVDAVARELPDAVDARLLEQIAEATELLGELIDCEQVGVRLATLRAPMCPRFHVDHIPCRLLITLSGEGTEWIPNRDVDWAVFSDLDSTELPVQDNRQVQQLSTGHWSLLKGGSWDESFTGTVHRSPHGQGERLLLSLDPIV